MKSILNTTASACAFTALLFSATSSHAQVIIGQTYESLAVSAEDPVWPVGSGSTSWDAVSGVVADGSSVFGAGNTRYLDVQASGVDINTSYTFTNTTDLVYFGIDFILDPSQGEVALEIGSLGDANGFVDARFRGTASPFVASADLIAFQRGPDAVDALEIATAANTHYRLELVLNSSVASQSYSGVGTITSAQSVAAGTYDIFLRNVDTSTTTQVGNDIVQNAGGGIDRIAWRNYGGRDLDYAIDNVNLSLIPEPSSFALMTGLLVCCGALGLRRRR